MSRIINNTAQYMSRIYKNMAHSALEGSAALMCLVDDGGVGAQQWVLEPHLQTHRLALRRLPILGNPLGHPAGRNASRRGPAIGQRGR